MIKKVAIVSVGALLLVTLLFGSRLPSYASTAYQRVRQTVDDSVSLEFKLRDARNQLQKLTPEINHMQFEFTRQEVRIERLRQEVDSSQDKLEDQLARIMLLKNHLESGETAFVTNGRSFSVTEVQQDIARRWDLYKTSKSIVETKSEVLQAQEAGLEAARRKIAETQGLREKLEVEIAQLEARMKLVEVAKTASEVHFDDSRVSRLRESLDDIRSRLEVEEHLVNSVTGDSFAGIPLEDSTASSDVMAEIDAYLAGSAPSEGKSAQIE